MIDHMASDIPTGPREARQLSREELSDLVDVMLCVGQAVLEAGAATFRAEQAMAHIGLGLGAERLELYITPTGIVATAICGNEQRTRVGRVGSLGVNMSQVLALYQLTRTVALTGGTLAGVRGQIAAIQAAPRALPAWTTIPAVAAACGAFAQILGAGWGEFCAAAAGAGLAQWLRQRLHSLGMNTQAATAACAFVASLVAWAVCQWLPTDQPDLAVIASVLLLVPGVPLVTSVLDLSNNDLVSGISRGMLAILLALSIGIGMLLTLSITGMQLR